MHTIHGFSLFGVILLRSGSLHPAGSDGMLLRTNGDACGTAFVSCALCLSNSTCALCLGNPTVEPYSCTGRCRVLGVSYLKGIQSRWHLHLDWRRLLFQLVSSPWQHEVHMHSALSLSVLYEICDWPFSLDDSGQSPFLLTTPKVLHMDMFSLFEVSQTECAMVMVVFLLRLLFFHSFSQVCSKLA